MKLSHPVPCSEQMCHAGSEALAALLAHGLFAQALCPERPGPENGSSLARPSSSVLDTSEGIDACPRQPARRQSRTAVRLKPFGTHNPALADKQHGNDVTNSSGSRRIGICARRSVEPQVQAMCGGHALFASAGASVLRSLCCLEAAAACCSAVLMGCWESTQLKPQIAASIRLQLAIAAPGNHP